MAEPNPTSRLTRGDDLVVVVVDVQDRLAAVMHRRDAVVRVASMLVRAAGVLRAPVIVTRQYPKGLGDVVPELAAVLDQVARETPVTVVDKMDFDCMAEPGFRDALESLGRTHVALVGMETHICITQTAFAVAGDGLTAHVVADGTCSRRDEDREVALARMGAAGIDVLPSESVIYESLGKAGTPQFRAMLDVVKGA